MSNLFISDPVVRTLVQEGLLERKFHDPLFPMLMFRKEFTAERWEERATEVIKTRSGTIAPSLAPMMSRQDPTPQSYRMEQWAARLKQYGGCVDTDITEGRYTLDDIILRDAKTLGLQAGKTVNRLARQAAFNAGHYGQGKTTTAGDGTTKDMPFINGFTRAYNPATQRMDPVSAANPLTAHIVSDTGALTEVQVVGVTPATAGDEYGPGTITLAASAVTTANQPIIASTASAIVRSGGGYSEDAISAGDVLTVADIRAGVARLKALDVPTFPDGYYHLHLSPEALTQVRSDTEFQLLFRGTGLDPNRDNDPYISSRVGVLEGCVLYENNDMPAYDTAPSTYGADGGNLALPLRNASGIAIGHSIIFGADAGIEYWDDPIQPTEAGINGKLGRWTVTNNGLTVMVDNIQMILRGPVDRFQRVVSTAWAFFGDHVIGTDYLADKAGPALAAMTSGRSVYKRVVLLQHALS